MKLWSAVGLIAIATGSSITVKTTIPDDFGETLADIVRASQVSQLIGTDKYHAIANATISGAAESVRGVTTSFFSAGRLFPMKLFITTGAQKILETTYDIMENISYFVESCGQWVSHWIDPDVPAPSFITTVPKFLDIAKRFQKPKAEQPESASEGLDHEQFSTPIAIPTELDAAEANTQLEHETQRSIATNKEHEEEDSGRIETAIDSPAGDVGPDAASMTSVEIFEENQQISTETPDETLEAHSLKNVLPEVSVSDEFAAESSNEITIGMSPENQNDENANTDTAPAGNNLSSAIDEEIVSHENIHDSMAPISS